MVENRHNYLPMCKKDDCGENIFPSDVKLITKNAISLCGDFIHCFAHRERKQDNNPIVLYQPVSAQVLFCYKSASSTDKSLFVRCVQWASSKQFFSSNRFDAWRFSITRPHSFSRVSPFLLGTNILKETVYRLHQNCYWWKGRQANRLRENGKQGRSSVRLPPECRT